MRLTHAIRDHIVDTEINKKFKSPKEELLKTIKAHVVAKIRASIPRLDSNLITDHWIKVSNEIECKGEMETEIDDFFYDNPLDDYLPIKWTAETHKVEIDSELEIYIARYRKIKEAEKDFRQKLRKIVYGFNSVKQLLEAVPEFRGYFSQDDAGKDLIPVAFVLEVRQLLVR